MNLPDKPSQRAVEISELIWKQKNTSVFTIARIIDAEAVQEIVRLQEMQNKRLNDYGINAGSMLRKELRSVIQRYGQESDVTVYQLIGCLEVVKQDVLDMMDKQPETL